MKNILLFSLMFVLVACSPSESAIQTAMAQTQAAMPTATTIPFADLNLDDLIIQSNDLPAGASGAQIGYYDEQSDVPSADYYISQELSYDNKSRGEIQVWVYEDIKNALIREKYETELLKFECLKADNQCSPNTPEVVSGLGDDAVLININNYIGPKTHTLVFSRCNGVVTIHFGPIVEDAQSIITYAQRLDSRLKPVLCR